MKTTERQRELACWFGDFEQDLGIEIDVPLGFDDDSGTIGPWLGESFCFNFLNELQKDDLIRYFITSCTKPVVFTIFIPFSKNTGTAKKGFLEHFQNGPPIERLQECVRQAIIWLPNESKKIIKALK